MSKKEQDTEMDIETLLMAHLTHHTIFYVPSSEEIIVQDRMSVDDEARYKDEFYAKIVIDVETVEQDVKDLCKPPTRFSGDVPLYRACRKMKFNTRKVTFKEAPEYHHNSFLLLVYLN
jgi:hypothetical protein